MRILLVHNRYAQRGGEDVAFEQEAHLLRERGHDVRTFEKSNVDIRTGSPASQVDLFARTVWSRSTYQAARRIIRAFRPQVMHVHNFLPIISPSIYHAAWAEDVPVVQTLHNYRLICPAATLFRDGRICEDCVGHSTWPGVVHACYRGSRAASLTVASMLQVHRSLKTWQKVDAYIAVSDFVRRQLIAGGLPADRIHVKPNFVSDDVPVRSGAGDYALYVGRLAPEKGLETLIQAWLPAPGRNPPPVVLKIAGSGPLEPQLRRLVSASNTSIDLLGSRTRDEVLGLLVNARFLVCPSEWYEPLAFVALEAFAVGVPVLASRIGGFVDLIDHGRNGLHFVAKDAAALTQAAGRLATDLDGNLRMGRAARQEYLARYTPDRSYGQLLDIYRRAQERKADG